MEIKCLTKTMEKMKQKYSLIYCFGTKEKQKKKTKLREKKYTATYNTLSDQDDTLIQA